MSDLKSRIDEIYQSSKDWGHETNRLVEIEIGLSLTPAERLRWLEETQEAFHSTATQEESATSKVPIAVPNPNR